MGVSCGIFLGLSSVLYKVALDGVTSDLIYKKVLIMSFLALAFQSAIFGIYILVTEGTQNALKLMLIWKRGLPVGFLRARQLFVGFMLFLLLMQLSSELLDS